MSKSLKTQFKPNLGLKRVFHVRKLRAHISARIVFHGKTLTFAAGKLCDS